VAETQIQAAICDYLLLRRNFFYRQNNMPASYIDSTGSYRFRRLPKHTPREVPDVLAIRQGQAIFLEVKSESGRQSADQKDFERAATEAGIA
jgi:hypothetical protein